MLPGSGFRQDGKNARLWGYVCARAFLGCVFMSATSA